jgi:hypothetical protein
MIDEIRLVAVNGMLGYGYPLASLDRAGEMNPHLFGVDAGSTDAGPFYLGSGTPLTAPHQIERDLRGAMLAARKSGVPLVIGSAGFGGASPHVDLCVGIAERIARDEGLHFRTAVIRSDLDRKMVCERLEEGMVRPLAGAPALTPEAATATSHLVGQMGTAPIAAALDGGAELVIAGRACDTAIYAALPILRGFDPGLAIHMAKIMECGAQCAVPLAPNDSLLGVIRRDDFLVRTLNLARTLTPESVAAHTLYEQPDPWEIHEPEGTVDMRDAEFEQVDPHTVRVSGSRLIPSARPTIKMEGARLVGYRAVVLAGIRDPDVIANIDVVTERAREMALANFHAVADPHKTRIDFRVYGRDAVLGRHEPRRTEQPHEVGLVMEVVAPTQEMASTLLALVRSSALHCPFEGRKTTAGNLAFAFSPSDMVGGPVYEFSVYHLLEVDDPASLFPVEFLTVGN